MIDLLLGAAESPILLAFVVVGGFAVFAIERLAGVNGPITRAVRAWQERELRRLQRDANAARARRENRDARVDELEDEVEWLREQLRRRREGLPEQSADTEPIPTQGRRNSGRHRPPPR